MGTKRIDICMNAHAYDFKPRQDLLDIMSYVRSIDVSNWNDPFAVTLRFQPMTDRYAAKTAVKQFFISLNRAIFKNAYRRYGKQLRRIGVFEGDNYPHYHLILESPKEMNSDEFLELVRKLWGSTRHGVTYIRTNQGSQVPQFHMTQVYSNGWVSYLGKSRDKISVDDADIENWFINTQHR